ncbi:MAG: glutamate--tRNA ligase [Myxococcota bacterium]|nr:glutamate--tRNA ligase [Myxococcota bacterium]
MSVNIPIPDDRAVRVQIAPSPTGDPHVGTAYTALFNRVFAHKHGGQFILRIEDTDQARSTPESEKAIFDSLRWLGLTWDEGPDVGGPRGPYRQSERTALYREHAAQLVAQGQAYPCFATAEELVEMRKVQKERGYGPAYDRRYRDLEPAEAQERVAAGEPHVIRLKMPMEGETVLEDGLRGEITFDNGQLDDQILLKSDGFPTYHLANVVDDHLMEITHVIRAEEWISSTPKHVILYEAFGWEKPCFIHLPLLRNDDQSKISKRKNPVSLEYFERAGILPEALVNFLGRMGWSMPEDQEKFSLDEMQSQFTWDRMSLGGPVFNLDKLDWLNGLYIRELSPEALVERLQSWLLNPAFLGTLAPLVQERIKRLEDFVPMTTYFFSDDCDVDAEVLIPKGWGKKEAYRMVKEVAQVVDDLRTWNAESIEGAIRALGEDKGYKPKELFMPIRWIITGRKATPGLFETMEAVGKARCQVRVRRAMLKLRP